MSWFRRPRRAPSFVFPYRGLLVNIDPDELKVSVDRIDITLVVNGEPVELDRAEQMRFMRSYFAYLDELGVPL